MLAEYGSEPIPDRQLGCQPVMGVLA